MNPSQVSAQQAPRFARRHSWFEPFIEEIDVALQVLSGAVVGARANPAGARTSEQDAFSQEQKRHAAGLMRVNHVGEVCAQALYRGQAVVCRDEKTVALLHAAAAEEVDHLAWCTQRLKELNSRPSLLNPFWYVGSFSLGQLAGRAGVARNLGFMAETERQVEAHLEDHLKQLPSEDLRSRRIVEQMKQDEIGHRVTAEKNGAAALPMPVKKLMTWMSKIMTSTAYRL